MQEYPEEESKSLDALDLTKVDLNRAVSIARRFLEQYHSPVILNSTRLDGTAWIISMEVGLLKDDVMEVAIDAETGKILWYYH